MMMSKVFSTITKAETFTASRGIPKLRRICGNVIKYKKERTQPKWTKSVRFLCPLTTMSVSGHIVVVAVYMSICMLDHDGGERW